MLPYCPKYFPLPWRPWALTFNKPQNKAGCLGGRFSPALGRSSRSTSCFTVTLWIKVLRGASFRVTQKPVPWVLSLSPDQGYNRVLPQFLQFLFLSSKNLLVEPLTLGGRLTLFLIVLFQPLVKVYCAAGAFFLFSFFIWPGLPLFSRASLSLLLSPLVKSNCYCKPTPCQYPSVSWGKPTKHSFQ